MWNLSTLSNLEIYHLSFTSVFLLLAAALDLRYKRVSLALTLPVMGYALWYQLTQGGQVGGLLIAWGAAFLLWQLKLYGGGDAKVLMALFGLYPDMSLLWAVTGAALAVSLPWLAFKYRRRWLNAIGRAAALTVTGSVLPHSRLAHRKSGIPVVWVYALGWFVWVGVFSNAAIKFTG